MKKIRYWTLQGAFNRVTRHLLKQKKQSRSSSALGEFCAYRGDGGLKCAIGCLIPDTVYSVHMENTTVVVINENYPELGFGRIVNELHELQCIHDGHVPWRGNLRRFQKQYKLKWPEGV